jgi:hypothetical protein
LPHGKRFFFGAAQASVYRAFNRRTGTKNANSSIGAARMTRNNPESGKFVPPSIAELTVRLLARTDAADALAAVAISEVEPHEVAVALRTEPRQAWQEGLAAARSCVASAPTDVSQPGEWASLIVRRGPVHSLPFAFCNFPQQVRDLNPLLQSKDLSELPSAGAEGGPASTGLRNWANQHIRKGTFPQALIGCALLRAAGDYDSAAAALSGLRGCAPAEWQAALTNEEAALLWERGEREQAARLWAGLPENTAVLFNRGMAALFMNKPAEGRVSLRKAVATLNDSDPWHHLASLYLALAEMRG